MKIRSLLLLALAVSMLAIAGCGDEGTTPQCDDGGCLQGPEGGVPLPDAQEEAQTE